MHHSYWACTPQLLSLRSRARVPQLLSPRAATTEAHVPRVHAPQQEKPQQWEARFPQLEKAYVQQQRPKAAKKKKKKEDLYWPGLLPAPLRQADALEQW